SHGPRHRSALTGTLPHALIKLSPVFRTRIQAKFDRESHRSFPASAWRFAPAPFSTLLLRRRRCAYVLALRARESSAATRTCWDSPGPQAAPALACRGREARE